MAEDDGGEKASGTAPAVFISYASRDAAIAEAACGALEHAGVTCWIAPRDVTPGTFYADEIVHAIDAAKAIVLILSENAAASPHVLREVERAASKRHPIVSLRIDKPPLPSGLEYFLNTSQWLEASGAEPTRVFPKLVAAARVAIQAPVTGPAAAPASRVVASSSPARSTNWSVIAAAFVGSVALLGWAADRYWLSGRRVAATAATVATSAAAPATVKRTVPDKSVAVLPFVDMSEKKDQEYFADGLSEELIDRLTKIPGLRVPARTSSFYFKDKPMPITQIARDLGVANVVEGSVRKVGNMVRITAQLIRADTGNHVWSVTYDRPMQDIFKTQDAIAKAIAGALRVTISDEVNYGGYETTSPEAFDLYLQAVSQSQRTWSTDEIQHRLALANRAVVLDPKFSQGWMVVAHLSTALAWKLGASNNQLAEQARHALKKAQETGYSSANSCLRVAEAHMIFDFDGHGAIAAYRKGIESGADGWQGNRCAYALSMLQGDAAQAVQLARKAVELDPYGEASWFDLADALYANGQSGDAEAAIKRDLELDSEDEQTMNLAAHILVAARKPQDALAMANRIEKSPEWRLEILPFIYDSLGRKADSDAALDDLIGRFGSVQPVSVAGFYAKKRNDDQAFAWLQRAYAERNTSIWDVQSDPNFKSIRGDARYSTLLRKLGLIE